MEKERLQLEKKRKFLMVLPLIALPFITLTFWAFGGGKGDPEAGNQPQPGINTELPGAQLEEGTLDKMSLYSKSGKDTQDNMSEYMLSPDDMEYGAAPGNSYGYGDEYGVYDAYGSDLRHTDPNEERVRRRLAELERVIEMQSRMESDDVPYNNYGSDPYGNADASLQRLEMMMQRMSGASEPDPELLVLDNMLDKIMDIQYPERQRDKLREQSLAHRAAVFAVSREARSNEVPYLKRPVMDSMRVSDTETDSDYYLQKNERLYGQQQSGRNGFYDIESTVAEEVQDMTAIPAVIHETQTLVSGANVRLRLTEDIYVNGILIPAGRFISGECTLSGERLQIKVSGIRYGNHLLPVRLSVYDMDGLAGIRIPGAITRDAAKDGADRAIQGVQFMSLDPSIGAQATGAGIEAVKSLLSRSAKLIKVTVKAGHPVLLYDEQSNNY